MDAMFLCFKAKGFETLRLGSHIIVYLFGWKVMLWRRRCLGDASLSPPSQPNRRLNEMSIGKMKRWSKGIIPWGTLRSILLYLWFSIELSEPFVAGRARWLITPHRRCQTDDAKIISWVTPPIRSFRWSCRTYKIKRDRSKRPPGYARWGSLRCLS